MIKELQESNFTRQKRKRVLNRLQKIEKERQKRLEVLKLTIIQLIEHISKAFSGRSDASEFRALDTKFKQIKKFLVEFEKPRISNVYTSKTSTFEKIEIFLLDFKGKILFSEIDLLLMAVRAGHREWSKLIKTRILLEKIRKTSTQDCKKMNDITSTQLQVPVCI